MFEWIVYSTFICSQPQQQAAEGVMILASIETWPGSKLDRLLADLLLVNNTEQKKDEATGVVIKNQ